ncbi:MAG TPA: hypothetical protein DCP89_00065 [Acidimicrobiaceae bacterium]|jgi:hypothetical protein|nr:hypothetical protein [Acidimicrobiaceae bacterium]|tara:strand:- start:93 stop:692 length:600 start_codon:yes stop_codon:yes gene_type:complete
MRKYLLVVIVTICVSCGGESAGDAVSVASLTESVTAGEANDIATSALVEEEVSYEEAQLNMAACMRKEYSTWPDPDFSTATGYSPSSLADLGLDISGTDFQEVLDSCRANELQGVVRQQLGQSPEERAETEDGVLELFTCVRETPGFEDLPDPNFSQNGLRAMRSIFVEGGFDLTEFQLEAQKCIEEGRGTLVQGGVGR